MLVPMQKLLFLFTNYSRFVLVFDLSSRVTKIISVMQTGRSGSNSVGSWVGTVYGSYKTALGGSNSEKSNMFHRWPPGAGPPRVGTGQARSVFFFLQIEKTTKKFKKFLKIIKFEK
jgi:hypothetical protein